MRNQSVLEKICFCSFVAALACFMTPALKLAIAADYVTTGKLTPDASRLWSPGKLAIDQAGVLYVVDAYKNRVQKFDSKGILQGSIRISRPSAIAASPDGNIYIGSHDGYYVAIYKQGEITGYLGAGRNEFLSISDITVDQNDGDIYVVDTMKNAVNIYTAAGALKGTMGGFTAPAAVAVTAGEVVVLDAPAVPCSKTIMVKGKAVFCEECADQCNGVRISTLDKTGTPVRSITDSSENDGNMLRPVALTVDSFGNIYVADIYLKAILVYDRMLEYRGAFTSSQNDLNAPVSLALSRDNSLYIASNETRSIMEIGLAGTVHFAPTGSLNFQSKK